MTNHTLDFLILLLHYVLMKIENIKIDESIEGSVKNFV